MRITTGIMLGMLMLATSACDKFADMSNEAQSITKQTMDDTKTSWRNFFTYSGRKQPDPLPQTRYCYQMQSDIVCYDSIQSQLTSRMIGYQDGDQMSWVQPGGGSLGASGGVPISLRPAPQVEAAAVMPTVQSAPVLDVDTSPAPRQARVAPLPSNIPPTAGEINVNDNAVPNNGR